MAALVGCTVGTLGAEPFRAPVAFDVQKEFPELENGISKRVCFGCGQRISH